MFFLAKLERRSTFPGEKRPRDDSERGKKKSERLPLWLDVLRQKPSGPDKHANIIDDLRMTITQRIMEADANVQHFAT